METKAEKSKVLADVFSFSNAKPKIIDTLCR